VTAAQSFRAEQSAFGPRPARVCSAIKKAQRIFLLNPLGFNLYRILYKKNCFQKNVYYLLLKNPPEVNYYFSHFKTVASRL